ncbi:M18 aspartyl aminopeptidase, putative [Plasmodium gallinaceum]|uniref:aspartyl aminopeptidase n=1 Tax=Plasmodium gallinaceum TaxID=5849 RepID=A0A1J1GWE8_PLAGA|nr:M18 aspartyl aminopeptidase, putative [Plasmodium gallinaceum]CRG96873.1 M18 aspartyl aminopeptidase, putative [Plasmodium gallinaceum]
MDRKAREYAQDLLEFIRNSGSSFLACKNLREKLKKNNFIHLKEGEKWNLKTNEAYVLSKENRNICSFFIGKNFNMENGSILISIGHIDSCSLKISPNNNIIKSKINQINVECYGAGMWNTWFDRGLGLSGQVVYKKEDKLIEKLIQINKSLFFLPSLAIHLQKRTRFDFSPNINYEDHLKPILSTTLFDNMVKKDTMKNSLNDILKKNDSLSDNKKITEEKEIEKKMINNNSSPLLYILSKELNCKEEDILDFELCLIDAQDPCFTGAYEEFIEGPRFDNLVGSYCIFEAFIELVNNIKNNEKNNNSYYDNNLYICIGYDHEEIGSLSEVGAKSYFTKNIIERIIRCVFKNELNNNETSIDEIYGSLVTRSILLSVDMSHCSHPNYPETIQNNHQLYFHEGIAIKYNTNKNYVTSPFYASLVKRTFELFSEKNELIKHQNFMVKNDTPCGSTVGSMLAASLSMPGIDIGIPQLAMHSIREIAGVHDIYYLIKGTLAFYTYYNKVLSCCEIDS